jgi:hypothetical protein
MTSHSKVFTQDFLSFHNEISSTYVIEDEFDIFPILNCVNCTKFSFQRGRIRKDYTGTDQVKKKFE